MSLAANQLIQKKLAGEPNRLWSSTYWRQNSAAPMAPQTMP
jgi:hypothetical protein